MILLLLFVLFFLLENLILPSLFRIDSLMLTPLFVLVVTSVYGGRSKMLIRIFIYIFIAELLLGVRMGSMVIPLSAISLVFIWLNRIFELSPSLKERLSLSELTVSAVISVVMLYGYIFVHILINSSLDINYAWQTLLVFSSLSMVIKHFVWGIAILILLKFIPSK